LNEIVTHLEQGALEVTGRLVDASNATLYANCSLAEKSMPVIYKPFMGFSRWKFGATRICRLSH
jgi:hypothetical protein